MKSILFILVVHLFIFAAGCEDIPESPDENIEASIEEIPACPPVRPEVENPRIQTKGALLIDALERSVILRGVNAGGRSKFPPFIPFDYAESSAQVYEGAPPFSLALEQFADRLDVWGHNVARLPFTWEALEPVRDEFDMDWLERYEALVDALSEREIYVIIDFHQDVYSRAFCGDGFPLWTQEDPGLPIPPMEECGDWFFGYIIPGPSQEAFDRFWANEDDLHNEFLEMWTLMAERFKNNPYVLGFELMNEPGAGSADEEVFVSTTLSDFYQMAIDHLAPIAGDALILFDSTGLEGVTSETSLRRPEGTHLVFAPHFYDPAALLPGNDSYEAADSYSKSIGKWNEQGIDWDMPVLLGEFGARRDLENGAEFVRKAYDALDEHLFHGTAWEYSESALDWNMEGLSMYTPSGGQALTGLATVRSFPAAIAGTLLSFSFDSMSREGVLTYEAVENGISEIVVPKTLYPRGLETHGEGVEYCDSIDEEAQRIIVKALASGTLTLTFSPKN